MVELSEKFYRLNTNFLNYFTSVPKCLNSLCLWPPPKPSVSRSGWMIAIPFTTKKDELLPVLMLSAVSRLFLFFHLCDALWLLVQYTGRVRLTRRGTRGGGVILPVTLMNCNFRPDSAAVLVFIPSEKKYQATFSHSNFLLWLTQANWLLPVAGQSFRKPQSSPDKHEPLPDITFSLSLSL